MSPNFNPTVITNPEAIRKYSLEQLCDRWRLAEVCRRKWSEMARHNNEPVAVAYTVNYERLLAALYAEIEGRADRLSFDTLMLLINAGNVFYTDNLFNPKP